MRPRGMTLLEQAMADGRFRGGDSWLRKVRQECGVPGPLPEVGKHVEVWLDLDMTPNTGHLRYRDVPYSPEIAVDRHQPCGALDFAPLKGLNVLIVAGTESDRLALLADRIAEFDPYRLWGMVLDDADDPMRLFVLEGAHV